MDQDIKSLECLVDDDYPAVTEMLSRYSSNSSNEQTLSGRDIAEKLQTMKRKTASLFSIIESMKAAEREMKEKIQELENKLKHIQDHQHNYHSFDSSTLDSSSRTEDPNFPKPIEEVGQNLRHATTIEQPRWELNWQDQREMNMPFCMSRYIQAVVLNQILYIGAGDAERKDIENEFKIMSCDLSSQPQWKEISYMAKWFAMLAVDSKLTLVGGRDKDRKDVNALGVFENNKWTNPYSPMPTSRSHCSAASYKTYIVIAGGTTVDLDTLSVIEIFDLNSKKWQRVCDATISFYSMKSVVLDDTWYLMGGYHGRTITHDVFVIQLNDLVANRETKNTWTTLPKLQCFYSTPVLVGDKLLSVGGRINAYKSVDTVYLYNKEENRWILASRLPCPINNCTYSIISNSLYVIGGYDGTNRLSSIYLCYLEERLFSI